MARVAVIASRAGLAEPLLDALRESPSVEVVERVPIPGAAGEPSGAGRLAGGRFDAIVYSPLPAQRDRACLPLREAAGVLGAIAQAGAPHVTIISSAAVYGPHYQNTCMTPEVKPIPVRGNAIESRWLEFESLAARHLGGRSDLALAILRPAPVLDGESYFSRLLRARLAPTYPGHDPSLQFLSPSDLGGAIRAVVEGRGRGVYNVAPAGTIPLRHALRVAGAVRLPVPRVLQTIARFALAPIGLAHSADQLRFIQYPWTVSGRRLKEELGFTSSQSSAQAIAGHAGPRARTAALRAFETSGIDDYGVDPGYIDRHCRTLFTFLHRLYWRVEVTGLEYVPRQGRVVLAGVHRGFMPFDGCMALHVLRTRTGRIPRFLIHPSLTKFPFLCDFMTKLGGLMACQENGDYVLERDEPLGMFPEGIRGAFTMYRRAYKLGKFGRDEFVRMALRHRAPIVPFVTVGSAEIYPILGRVDWSWFKQYTEWPFLPITPTPVPLPSKWHTRFLAPIHVERQHPPEAASDPDLVREISQQVRVRMEAAIDDMLRRRKSIFVGSIFGQEVS